MRIWEGPVLLNYPFCRAIFVSKREEYKRIRGQEKFSIFPCIWHRSHLPPAVTDVPTYSTNRTSCFQADVENRETFCLWPKHPNDDYLSSLRAVTTRMKSVFYKNNFAMRLLDWEGRGDPGMNKLVLRIIFQAICTCIAEPPCCLSQNVWPHVD